MNLSRPAGLALALGAALFIAAPASQAQTFDFESATATSPPSSGALATLTQTSGGLTAVFTRQGGTGFDIFNTTGFGFPASWGARSLDPFSNTGASAFVVDFSAPLTSISLEYGDFAGDSDTLTLDAYSGPGGTGTLLASTTDNYGNQSIPTFDTVSVSASGIQSIVFIGGSSAFPNSVYYDNLSATVASSAVPEPANAAMLGLAALGSVGLLLQARRRKATVQA